MEDSPQALHILFPESSRRHKGVVLVPQFAHERAVTPSFFGRSSGTLLVPEGPAGGGGGGPEDVPGMDVGECLACASAREGSMGALLLYSGLLSPMPMVKVVI